MPWEPRMESCQFVPRASVFEGLGKAWDALSSSFLWTPFGSDTRTLVRASVIAEHLRAVMVDLPPGDGEAWSQAGEALGRLRLLGEKYVDLEG